MPWLMKEVKKEMGNMIESRELLMGKAELIKIKQQKCINFFLKFYLKYKNEINWTEVYFTIVIL